MRRLGQDGSRKEMLTAESVTWSSEQGGQAEVCVCACVCVMLVTGKVPDRPVVSRLALSGRFLGESISPATETKSVF